MDFKLVLRVRKLWLQVQKVNGLVGIFFFFWHFYLHLSFTALSPYVSPYVVPFHQRCAARTKSRNNRYSLRKDR